MPQREDNPKWPVPGSEELVGYLLELAAACPLGERDAACPFHALCDRSDAEQEEYLRVLDTSEQRVLFFHHQECSMRRKDEATGE